MTLHPDERDPEPPFDHRALFDLLERPDVVAKMVAAQVATFDVGFAENGPDPHHDALWAIILDERPDWRPWHEWAARQAVAAFKAYRAQPRTESRGPGTPHDEVARRFGLS